MYKLFFMYISENNGMSYAIIKDDYSISYVSYEQMVDLILQKKVDNAKTENGVVKIIDSNYTSLSKLNKEKNSSDRIFYIIDEIIDEKIQDNIYTLVSNKGTILKGNIAVLGLAFKNNDRLLNGKIITTSQNKKELKINMQKTHTTALIRPPHHNHFE